MSEAKKNHRDAPLRVVDDRMVTYTPNDHVRHTGTFAFKKEWPGHVLAEQLNRDPQVKFSERNRDAMVDAGGRLVIQTTGQKTPTQALIDALDQTIRDLTVIEKKVLDKALASTPSPIATFAPLSQA